jgi:hypothetical protein
MNDWRTQAVKKERQILSRVLPLWIRVEEGRSVGGRRRVQVRLQAVEQADRRVLGLRLRDALTHGRECIVWRGERVVKRG